MHEKGRSLVLGAALALSTSFGCGPSNTFGAELSGANESPAVNTSATGDATVTLKGDTMNYTIAVSGLTSNAISAHLHVAPAGTAGPVVVPLNIQASTSPTGEGAFTEADIINPTNPPLSTPIVTMDDLVERIRAGDVYVNIHSGTFTGGEVRGQLAPK